MVAKLFDGDAPYMAWLREHPSGFVLNSRRRDDPGYMVLGGIQRRLLESADGTPYTINLREARCWSAFAQARRPFAEMRTLARRSRSKVIASP